MSELLYRVNVYVATKNGQSLVREGNLLYPLTTVIIATNERNKALGHADAYNIVAKPGTRFAMYEDA